MKRKLNLANIFMCFLLLFSTIHAQGKIKIVTSLTDLKSITEFIGGDQVDVFEFDTVFTLFELVEGIGWELGFHGTPRECQIRR